MYAQHHVTPCLNNIHYALRACVFSSGLQSTISAKGPPGTNRTLGDAYEHVHTFLLQVGGVHYEILQEYAPHHPIQKENVLN
jgi:hypothetical protein